jgi:multiple sugar transport system ATP-binding protein
VVRNPSVFLMDEPLSNLDAALRVRTRTEIRRLQRELGVTSIFVTHDQEEAMVLSDRVAVMRGGELQQLGAPMQVYRDPANLFVASFVGSPSMNMLEARISITEGKLVADVSGQRVYLPRSVARSEWAGERRALLGARPTDLGIVAPDLTQLQGRVFLVEGWTVKATVDPDHAPAIGERVGISLIPNRVCLFDPETEARI